jgi:hypothetical protein
VYAQLGLKVHRYSEWLTAEDRANARRVAASLPVEQIPGFMLDGLAIGEHAHAGALRFFATARWLTSPTRRRCFAATSRRRC